MFNKVINKYMKQLKLPNISFNMPITDLIMELEQLRYKELVGTTHPLIFHQIREIFQMLESIGSSRIEGNNTTIMDYVEETKIRPENEQNTDGLSDSIREILNIENAMRYIEENITELHMTTKFLRELHQLTVEGLNYRKEGAAHPGYFRNGNVRISGSSHVPPDYTQVESLMQDLIDFVNREDPPKYDLLKIAIAHHRFVWIHPFENGNGRVVRLFTYALLLKFVFKSRERIINPVAVFCSDRDAYYRFLSKADKSDEEGMIEWASYMLNGLKSEIEKIDKLTDYATLKKMLLFPALQDAAANKYITEDSYKILKLVVDADKQTIQSSDISHIFPSKSSSDRSRIIRSLVSSGMLMPIYQGARKYTICFANNYLLRSVLKTLDKQGFLPDKHGLGD